MFTPGTHKQMLARVPTAFIYILEDHSQPVLRSSTGRGPVDDIYNIYAHAR